MSRERNRLDGQPFILLNRLISKPGRTVVFAALRIKTVLLLYLMTNFADAVKTKQWHITY